MGDAAAVVPAGRASRHRGTQFPGVENDFPGGRNHFRDRGIEFPVHGNEFRRRGTGFRVRGNEFRGRGIQFRVHRIEFRDRQTLFRVAGKGVGGKFYAIFDKIGLEITPAQALDSRVMVPSVGSGQSKSGDCGAETNETRNHENKMRIPIPENKDQFITLAKALLAKHTELGAASPLNGIEGIANLAALVNTADINNQQSKLLAKQATTATEACDKAIGPDAKTPGGLRFLVTASRGTLAGQNRGQEHKLGDWGFGVIAAPEPSPEAKAAAKAARAAAKAAKKQPPTA